MPGVEIVEDSGASRKLSVLVVIWGIPPQDRVRAESRGGLYVTCRLSVEMTGVIPAVAQLTGVTAVGNCGYS